MTHSDELQQWLAEGENQPEGNPPAWLQQLVQAWKSSEGIPGRDVPQNSTPRYSAVLVLLAGTPGNGVEDKADLPEDATVLLTHRTPTMRNHSGQIAYPGGMREPEDQDPIDTAIREAVEETGVDPATIRPLAVGRPLYIAGSDIAVVPVVAYWEDPHGVQPMTEENDWVQAVSLQHLINPACRFQVGFTGWSGPAFQVGTMVLWGFSASVLDEVIRLGGWEKTWDSETVQDLLSVLARSSNGEALKMLSTGIPADNTQDNTHMRREC